MTDAYWKLKRGLAMLLSILMLMSVLPVSALADTGDPSPAPEAPMEGAPEPTATPEPTVAPEAPEAPGEPEPTPGEPEVPGEPEPTATPEPKTALPEAEPSLPPVDKTLKLDQLFEGTLTMDAPQITFRLKVTRKMDLQLTFAGAVAISLIHEQDETTRAYSDVQAEDGSWSELTKVFKSKQGSWFITVTALEEAFVDDQPIAFSLIFTQAPEPTVAPEVPGEPEPTPEVPGEPEPTPVTPEEPGEPEPTPEAPEVPGEPEPTPEAPEVPGEPEPTPEAPEVPGEPEPTPEVPEVPSEPEPTPEAPEVPGEPEPTPEAPEEPGEPEPTPEAPEEPGEPEPTPAEPEVPGEPEPTATPEPKTALPEAEPSLPPVDKTLKLDQLFEGTLTMDAPQITFRLKVTRKMDLQLTFAGAVAISLIHEQDETTRAYSGVQAEDGSWSELTKVFKSKQGSWFITVTALEEAFVDDQPIAFSLIFTQAPEPTVAPEVPGEPEPTPVTPEVPGEPEPTPEAPEAPGEPEPTPEAPEVPGEPEPTPAAPEEPGEPEPTPAAPEEPGEPEPTPEAPEVPGEPEPTPEAPEEPGEPEPTPEAPEAPGEPEPTPEAPEVPGEPEPTPEAPEAPGEPEPTPVTPEEPGEPEPTPEAPEVPGEPEPTPEAPEAPGEPEPTPEAPEVPGEPEPTPEAPEEEPQPPRRGAPKGPEYVFPQAVVYLTDILAATGRTVDNNSELELDVDSSVLVLSERIVKNKNLDRITLTATDHFDLATLTITKNKNNVQTITLGWPAPAPIEYTFADDGDYVQLLNLLTDNGIYTVTIEEATPDDPDQLDVLYQINDYMVLPLTHFDTARLTVRVREGETYLILFHYPVVEWTEQTLTPDMPDGAAMTLSGRLPQGTEAQVTTLSAPEGVKAENVLGSYDITLTRNGREVQPEAGEVVEFTLTNPAIAAAIEAGQQIVVLHRTETGVEQADATVVGTGVVVRADHFSGYDVISFSVIFRELLNAIFSLRLTPTVYEHDNICLTGMLPEDAIVDVTQREVAIDGKDAILAYDIKIYANQLLKSANIDWQPAVGNPIEVQVKSDALDVAKVDVYHMADTASAAALVTECVAVTNATVSFSADSFSVYVLTETIEKIIEASDGNTYRIAVEYDAASGIPADAELMVEEVSQEDYASYLTQAAAALGANLNEFSYAKLFNISIVKDGVTYQPNDTVTVSVELLDAESVSDVQVVHFENETTAAQLVASTDGKTVTFETDGFSVFSFLDKITLRTFDLANHIVTTFLGENTGTLYENDDIILTGSMPATGIVEVERVNVSLGGTEALVAYDIKIYGGPLSKAFGYTWQPESGTIRVTMKSDALTAENVDIYHMATTADDPKLVSGSVAVADDHSVSFDASSFSVYVIIDHEGGPVVTPRVEFHFIDGTTTAPQSENDIAWYTSTPYTFRNKAADPAAGNHQTTLIVKDGDRLESIEAPGDIGESAFFGWYTVNKRTDNTVYNHATDSYSGNITYSWPDDTQRVELDNTISVSMDSSGNITWTVSSVSQTVTAAKVDADGCAHVYLAPIYTNYHFVNFHLAPYGDQSAAYIMTRKLIVLGNSPTTDVRVGDINSTFRDPTYYRFVGWEYYTGSSSDPATDRTHWVQVVTVNENDTETNTHPPKTGAYLTVTGVDYDLYPIFVQIRWVNFNRGAAHNGSDYLAPRHIQTSDSSTETYPMSSFYGATETKRVGYDFQGWYLNACFGNGNDFLNEGQSSYDYTTTVNGSTVTVHYGAIIQLTDSTGAFVSAVRGKDFYTLTDNNNIQMVSSGTTLPTGARKLFSIDNDGKLYVYTGIRDRLPVYAKWTPQSGAYKVVIWKQKSTDSVNAVDLSQHDTWVANYKTHYPSATNDQAEAEWDAVCKHYDYYEYYTRYETGGATVSPMTAPTQASPATATDPKNDLSKTTSSRQVQDPNGNTVEEYNLFTGFALNNNYDQNVSVDPQGTTVLNVYYDRNVHTLTFQIYDYTYTIATGTTGTQYGYYNGQYVRIYYNNNNGTWYRTRTGGWGGYSYSDPYNDTRYTRSNSQSWQTIKEIRALYEHNISDQFPIFGTNGVTYNNGERWDPQSNSLGWTNVMLTVETMPNDSVVFHLDTANRPLKTMNYYVEVLPGATGVVTFNNTQFVLHNSINARYNGVTAEDFLELEGFTKLTWTDANGDSTPYSDTFYIYNTTQDQTINFYYTRNKYTLTFMSNYPGETGATQLSTVISNIPYEENLAGYASQAPNYPKPTREWKFDGWFVDASCTVEFDFDSETMPAGNVVVYGGWSMIKYRVLIDPNGGVMDHINYPVYGNSLNQTGLTSASYNDAFATYFNNTAAEYITTDQDIDNPMVRISNAEAAQILASGGQVYRYVNMQFDKAENLSGGIYASYAPDARNAVYILDTPGSIAQYYNYYCRVIADQNDGTAIPTQSTWESLYLSASKYRELKKGESYTFLGWYELNESTGVLSNTPFDFSEPTDHRTHLVAQWRLNGGYTLKYTPDYTFVDEHGVSHTITGSMSEFYDPDPDSVEDQYADGATTQAMEEPTALRIDGVYDTEHEYQFRGWQIVNVVTISGLPAYSVPDDQIGVYYTAGQPITVRGRYAKDELKTDGITPISVIHLRAVYEKRSEAYRRPDIVNLTLNAGWDGTLDTTGNRAPVGLGYVNTTDPDSLPAWNYPGHQYIDTDHKRTVTIGGSSSEQPYQILFGDTQSNTAVHLYKYATTLTQDEVTGTTLNPEGTVLFTHSAGFKLIGFDLDAPDTDFIPDYPADAVIAVSPGEAHTLYAVWEPMVYISFVNDTNKGPVTIHLSGSNRAMYVVSQTNGSFSRTAVDTSQDIVIAQGETMKFVMPYGENETINVTGTNNLGTSYLLSADSLVPPVTSTVDRMVRVPNTESFSFSETLINNPNGIVVTFRAEKAPRTLVLKDNYNGDGTGGGTTEVNFQQTTGNVVYYINESDTFYDLTSTNTRLGYEFVGWDEDYTLDPTTTQPTYSASAGWRINNLNTFFKIGQPEEVEVKTLYAVWKANLEASTVYVWKEVPEPGDQNKEFTFTVAFSGEFSYDRSYYQNYGGYYSAQTGRIESATANPPPTLTRDFVLKHGEYLKIVSSKERYNSSTTGNPYLSITVERYKKNTSGSDTLISSGTLGWTWQHQTNQNGVLNSDYYYKNFQFTSLTISVTEADYTARYDLSQAVAAQTTQPLTTDLAARRVYWTDTFAGGTVIFHNTRKTADVVITKTLLPDTLPAENFSFAATFLDSSDNPTVTFEGYTLSTTSRYIASGTGEWRIEGIPTGAKLKITENVDSNQYSTTTTATSTGTVTDLDTANNIFCFDVEDDTAVNFTNELKHKTIKLVLVDDDTPANTLAGGTFTLPDVFEGTNMATAPDGVIWQGDAYVGTYTLTEHTSPGVTYRKLQSTASITIQGIPGANAVRATPGAGDTVGVSYDSVNDIYTVTVVNPKLFPVTVKKTLRRRRHSSKPALSALPPR